MQVKKSLLFLLKSYGDIILAIIERVITLKRLHAISKAFSLCFGDLRLCTTKAGWVTKLLLSTPLNLCAFLLPPCSQAQPLPYESGSRQSRAGV